MRQQNSDGWCLTDPDTRVGLLQAQACNVRSKCRCSCVLQFTLCHAFSCVLHRPPSQLIHCIVFYVWLSEQTPENWVEKKISSHQTFPGGRVTQNLVCWRELFEPSHGTSRQGSELLGVASQKAKRNRRRAHLANQSRQASAPRDAVVNNSATRPTGEISLSGSQRTFNDPTNRKIRRCSTSRLGKSDQVPAVKAASRSALPAKRQSATGAGSLGKPKQTSLGS